MTKLKKGYIYFIKNNFWNNLKKIGVSQNVNNRIKSLNTACPEPIEILYITKELVDKYYYEHIISKYIYKYRYNANREFYNITEDEFNIIIKFIELMNDIYDTEDKLLEYIKLNDPLYYKMRYTKLKKKIFIDTNYKNKDNELNMSMIL
jgi:hypothetical protein